MATLDEKRAQVIAQCKAVAHMATAIAQVHADKAQLLEAGADLPLEVIGPDTAAYMEALGDILNGMDAVVEEDAWTDPIFEKAHELWPRRPYAERAALRPAGRAQQTKAREILEDFGVRYAPGILGELPAYDELTNRIASALTASPAAAMREALEAARDALTEVANAGTAHAMPCIDMLQACKDIARDALKALPLPSPEPAGAEAVGDHKWTLVRQDFLDQLIDARDHASSAEAEIERLRRERDHYRAQWNDVQLRLSAREADLADALRLLELFATLADASSPIAAFLAKHRSA